MLKINTQGLANYISPQAKAESIAIAPRPRSAGLPESVHPWEIVALADQFDGAITTLSLDCFDTLLWRQTRTPIDVFFALAHSKPFRRRKFSAKQRAVAESIARSLKLVRKNRHEVNLEEIYCAAFPDLEPGEIEELSRAELDAEIATCFAFPQTVDLLMEAKRRGLRVVITSDTYFSSAQLRELLQARLPSDAYAAIDSVFCSSEYGQSKSSGLFTHVLEALRLKPEKLLHLGDNWAADVLAARLKGVSGVHLLQHQDYAEEVMRLSASAGALLAPEQRREHPLPELYHGLWAEKPLQSDGDFALGYLGLGPIVYAFARFIVREVDALRALGKTVKPVFLMRDAYLPMRVVEALSPDHTGPALAISRFSALAASFVDQESIRLYLARSAGSGRYEAMLKQLLVPEKIRRTILQRTRKATDPLTEFVKQVCKPQAMEAIVTASQAYRSRFYAYLEKNFDLSEGDTLLFVDLGYEGTAQRCLAPVLAKERGLEVRGCYLLASSVPGWERDRSGLLDPGNSDDRVLGALIPYVAVLEDLCTAHLGSVVDYRDDGTVVTAECVIADAQFKEVSKVQDWAIQFSKDADSFCARSGVDPSPDALRFSAMASIARLLFLPSQAELEYLDGFRLDLGMGTEDSFALFDREAGLDGLRKRGLLLRNHIQGDMRMNFPFELRNAGIELSMTLLAHQRYGFEFAQVDLNQRRMSISALALGEGSSSEFQVEALATHDGYFSLTVPVGMCEYEIGLLFGKTMSWMQLLSMELIRTDMLGGKQELPFTTDVRAHSTWEQTEVHDAGIVALKGRESFVFISTRAQRDGENRFALRIIFRPLMLRPTPANDVSGTA